MVELKTIGINKPKVGLILFISFSTLLILVAIIITIILLVVFLLPVKSSSSGSSSSSSSSNSSSSGGVGGVCAYCAQNVYYSMGLAFVQNGNIVYGDVPALQADHPGATILPLHNACETLGVTSYPQILLYNNDNYITQPYYLNVSPNSLGTNTDFTIISPGTSCPAEKSPIISLDCVNCFTTSILYSSISVPLNIPVSTINSSLYVDIWGNNWKVNYKNMLGFNIVQQ